MYVARALVVWAAVMAGESVLGALRTFLLAPALGEVRARQVAFPFGAALILAVAGASVRWVGAGTRRKLLVVGLLWAALTLAFEAAMGRLVMGLSWDRVIADFDVSRGGLMGIGLAYVAACPLIASALRDRAGLATGRG